MNCPRSIRLSTGEPHNAMRSTIETRQQQDGARQAELEALRAVVDNTDKPQEQIPELLKRLEELDKPTERA